MNINTVNIHINILTKTKEAHKYECYKTITTSPGVAAAVLWKIFVFVINSFKFLFLRHTIHVIVSDTFKSMTEIHCSIHLTKGKGYIYLCL